MSGDIHIAELFDEDCAVKPTDMIGTWLGHGLALKVSLDSSGDLRLEERTYAGTTSGLLQSDGEWSKAALKMDDGADYRSMRLRLQDDHLMCCSSGLGEEWKDCGTFIRQERSGLVGVGHYLQQ